MLFKFTHDHSETNILLYFYSLKDIKDSQITADVRCTITFKKPMKINNFEIKNRGCEYPSPAFLSRHGEFLMSIILILRRNRNRWV